MWSKVLYFAFFPFLQRARFKPTPLFHVSYNEFFTIHIAIWKIKRRRPKTFFDLFSQHCSDQKCFRNFSKKQIEWFSKIYNFTFCFFDWFFQKLFKNENSLNFLKKKTKTVSNKCFDIFFGIDLVQTYVEFRLCRNLNSSQIIRIVLSCISSEVANSSTSTISQSELYSAWKRWVLLQDQTG